MRCFTLFRSGFDYENMDEGAWDESEGEEEEERVGRADTMAESELEELLLQNMSDGDSGLEEEGESEDSRTRKRNDKSR